MVHKNYYNRYARRSQFAPEVSLENYSVIQKANHKILRVQIQSGTKEFFMRGCAMCLHAGQIYNWESDIPSVEDWEEMGISLDAKENHNTKYESTILEAIKRRAVHGN